MNKKNNLIIDHVHAALENKKEILHDVSLTFSQKNIYAIMGPNGSGKSTLAHVIMGNPMYFVKGNILFGNIDILKKSTTDRARSGLFLSFQSPQAVSGVSVVQILRTAYQETHNDKNNLVQCMDSIKKYADKLHIEKELLSRSIHDGFSGGERKKIELLQALVLKPTFAIFDEIDTGLDVDALRLIGKGIMELHKNGTGVILITHYKRLLTYVPVDRVFVLLNGRVVKAGNKELVDLIEKQGYKGLQK